ncbi:hypothetical protein VTK73DRAFT_4626 [Phialemonium thermophilum]|uniref:Uncharacterized protein n=1 Tax=Phialemonium thermophilum TaxID=223376 RepID=A0ABR3V7P1_9PEZI
MTHRHPNWAGPLAPWTGLRDLCWSGDRSDAAGTGSMLRIGGERHERHERHTCCRKVGLSQRSASAKKSSGCKAGHLSRRLFFLLSSAYFEKSQSSLGSGFAFSFRTGSLLGISFTPEIGGRARDSVAIRNLAFQPSRLPHKLLPQPASPAIHPYAETRTPSLSSPPLPSRLLHSPLSAPFSTFRASDFSLCKPPPHALRRSALPERAAINLNQKEDHSQHSPHLLVSPCDQSGDHRPSHSTSAHPFPRVSLRSEEGCRPWSGRGALQSTIFPGKKKNRVGRLRGPPC